MKIGLITVHCSINAGASLQAYALSKVLYELGYEVELIDYRPYYFTSGWDSLVATGNFKQLIKYILFGGELRKEIKTYKEFETSRLPIKSKVYKSLDDFNYNMPECDVFLCGSDQIWNPQHTHYDPVMELEFAKRNGKPCYSYAASIGQDILKEKDIEFLKKYVSDFNRISVREETAKDILINEIGLQKVERHIDPTLLLSQEQWRELSSDAHRKIKGKYILFYPLANNEIAEQILVKLKEKYKLPVVAMSRKIKKSEIVDVQLRHFSPEDFVALIDHAEYVVTNSFHGCVFSLILEKKLISYKNKQRNTRLECLFSLNHIKNPQISDIKELETLDWNEYFSNQRLNVKVLEKEKEKALEYLRNIYEG